MPRLVRSSSSIVTSLRSLSWARVANDSSIKGLLTSGLSRILVIPFSAASALLSAHMVISRTGTTGFAIFSIVVALQSLLPISDFGVGASVTDVAARYGPHSKQLQIVFYRAVKILLVVCAFVIGVCVLLSLMQLWAPMLSLPRSSNTEAGVTCVVAAIALAVPLSTGQRVLLGLHKQALSVLLIGAGSVASLGLVWIALSASDGLSAVWLAAVYTLGPLGAQLVVFLVGIRYVGVKDRSTTIGVNSTLDSSRGTGLSYADMFAAAGPMAVMAVTLPIAYQSDRILVAHLDSLDAVALYSGVAVLYAPLLSVVTTAGFSLWPRYIALENNPKALRELFHFALGAFLLAGAAMFIGLVFVGPQLVSLMAPELNPGTGLFVAFGMLLVVFAANMPAGMFLMDLSGRRMQAVLSLVMLAVKIALSILLIRMLGEVGAVCATVVAVFVTMVVPNLLVARRRIEQRLVEKDLSCQP